MKTIIETTPKFNVTVKDIEDLPTELANYTAIYQELFGRREQKEHHATYLEGLMLDVPNKSVETMMLNLKGDDANSIRSMQHFLPVARSGYRSEGSWQDKAILQRHWQEVSHDLGDENGVLIGDDSGFPKQGEESVAVKRQWCGELGKVANCQVGVFLGYASQHGRTLLDRRLYLPQEWVEDDDYAERRRKCGVPQEITFKTKPTLLLEMVRAVHADGSLPFQWLACDEAFGRDTAFLDQVGDYLWYLAEVASDTCVWLQRPQTAVPAWSGRGRKPTRQRLIAGEPETQELNRIAASLPAACLAVRQAAWTHHTIKEGSKGTLVADFAALRVVAVRDGLPGPEVWLVLRRDPATGEIKYYLSNAPAETQLATFAWVSGMRWPIETCFEEGKQEIGLGDYQVRSWTGWHHHMTLCILAHFFLVRLQIRLKDKAPKLTLPQAILLLKVTLEQPQLDAQKAIEIVNYYQRRHHAAYLSHRKRRSSNNDETEVSL
jgi:SRSO17 transposase